MPKFSWGVTAALILVAWFCTALGLSACSPRRADQGAGPITSIENLAAAPRQAEQRLRVVATTSLVADPIHVVGGENVDLTVLLPPDADPHAFQPSPQDLRSIAEAHVVLVNGLGLEEAFLDDLHQAAPNVPFVSISEGVQALEFGLGLEGGESLSGEDGGEAHAGEDPHAWFNPRHVMTWTENASRALSRLDPVHAADYQARAHDYVEQLAELDAWIQTRLEAIPGSRRILVTDHQALGYFAARYDFKVIATIIPAYSTLAEPSARQLADLSQVIQEWRIPAIFISVSANPAQAQRIAEDTGVEIVRLFIGSLSEESGPAGTYLEFMDYNVNAIAEALEP